VYIPQQHAFLGASSDISKKPLLPEDAVASGSNALSLATSITSGRNPSHANAFRFSHPRLFCLRKFASVNYLHPHASRRQCSSRVSSRWTIVSVITSRRTCGNLREATSASRCFHCFRKVMIHGSLLRNAVTPPKMHPESAVPLQSDLVIPDLAIPDPSLYRTVRDQRFPTHQNLPRYSGRSPNTGPDGISTAVIPVPHTKYIRYTGRLLTSWNTDSANHLGSPPLLVHTRALPYTKSTTHCCSRIGNCSFLVFVFQLPIPIINRPNSIA
jgi:hypothetical protein